MAAGYLPSSLVFALGYLWWWWCLLWLEKCFAEMIRSTFPACTGSEPRLEHTKIRFMLASSPPKP